MSHPPFDLPTANAYLIALSGGADSRLLLELTVRAVLERPEAERARVEAIHVHHGIRGEEADRDEAFCRAVCAALGVPLSVEHADIPARAAASGRSEETEARLARYECFIRVMRARGIPVLLTAHHADDGLETVLHRLLRGSGSRGMGGIPPTRSLGDGLTVHRPLLAWTRREILDECAARGLESVTDSTNLLPDCTRNRLRLTVIPALEAIAGEGVPQRAATRLSKAAREDDEALTAIAAARLEACPSRIAPDAAAIAAEMPAVAKRMLALAYAEAEAPTADTTLSAYHLDALLALCRDAREGAVSDELPGGKRAAIRQGRLVFEAPTVEPPAPALGVRPLPLGDTRWDSGLTVRVERLDAPTAPLGGDAVYASACFPAAHLPLPLSARGRTEGELILSHGMRKKVKKLLCDKHIPTGLRDRLPRILTPDGELLWLPGVAFRDGYAPPKAGTCLRISVLLSH